MKGPRREPSRVNGSGGTGLWLGVESLDPFPQIGVGELELVAAVAGTVAAASWLLRRATRDSRRRPRWVSAVMFRVWVLAAILGDVGWVTLHHP